MNICWWKVDNQSIITTGNQVNIKQTLDCYRSIFVTLILTSGLPDPVFKNKKIYFPSTEAYHKNYTENQSLTEQFEH